MLNELEIFWGNVFKNKSFKKQKTEIEFLKSVPFFNNLSTKQVSKISNILHKRSYSEGECFFEVNQPGAALFIIQKGKVGIEIPSKNDTPILVTQLVEGDFLGELALLDNSPRSATARALEPTIAFSLFRSDLQELIEVNPDVASLVFQSLSLFVGERLRKTTDLLKQRKMSS
jgi:CRP/FNR family cyclic AMP-dependent transcriptional regulator